MACVSDSGQPVITGDVMCGSCRRVFAQELRWLVEDYAMLKTSMPSPRGGTGLGKIRVARRDSYGHPREWASDMCRTIADVVFDLAAGFTAGDSSPATRRGVAGEVPTVSVAYKYLTDRWHDVCSWQGVTSHTEAVRDVHRSVRTALGYTRLVERLPTPCPACNRLTLTRETGVIRCGGDGCGTVIREEMYGWTARLVADDVLDKWAASNT